MGVDARILIRRVPRSIVNDEWLKSISWRLCESIGAEKFFTSDGLPPAEYERVSAEWHAAFDAHPLYPQFDAARNDNGEWRRLREKIVADIGEAPKARRLAVEPTNTHYREEGEPAPGAIYTQDGDDIVSENGECLLSVSLWGRFYGPGYERGDILAYCAIAEWLEKNISGCEIWYGGDSSGCCAEPFHALKRQDLRNHLYGRKGRDYYSRGNPFMDDDGIPRPAACSMCPNGKYCGTRHGWGQGYASYHCPGCGKSKETRDSGATWMEKKND